MISGGVPLSPGHRRNPCPRDIGEIGARLQRHGDEPTLEGGRADAGCDRQREMNPEQRHDQRDVAQDLDVGQDHPAQRRNRHLQEAGEREPQHEAEQQGKKSDQESVCEPLE